MTLPHFASPSEMTRPRLTGPAGREDGHVDLDLRLVRRIGDGARGHLPHRGTEDAPSLGAGELPAQRLEVRAGDLRPERRPGVGPDLGAQPEFQVGPPGPHDRLVERDERLGDAVARPPGPEHVGLLGHEAGVLEHVERVRDVGRLTADVVRDAAPRLVPRGDRGQHRVVERRVADVRLLREQVPCLAEQRAIRVEHRAHHPGVEVVRARRGIVTDELPAVRRRAARRSRAAGRRARDRSPPRTAPRHGSRTA